MQVPPRLRNVLVVKNSLIQLTTTTAWVSSSSSTLNRSSSFHSTPVSFEKWKNKWKFDAKPGQQPVQPSKNYIRYATRQKRADAKRALKDLLFRNGASKFTIEGHSPKMEGRTNWNEEDADHSDSPDKKSRSKSYTRRASNAQQKRMKRKFKRESFSDDDNPETIFQATYGNRWYTWSFKSWEESYFQNATNGFEWREQSSPRNGRNKDWQNESDIESEDESCSIGSTSDRTILGLPSKGPLKMEDVKNAFRLSALKWHPDKHQGPSKATAEDKFKLCVNAYKSLCGALAPS